MKVLLIRHARAEERRLLQRDRTRALTVDGRRRMRRAVRGLKSVEPRLTGLATSPLVRARETAALVGAGYPAAEIEVLPALAPGGARRAALTWLQARPADACLALVGHEPDLGRLAGWLLTGQPREFVRFKKGAVALIEFAATPRAGHGTLAWLLTAGQLAELA
jgi:phosphohistidine phosphatase